MDLYAFSEDEIKILKLIIAKVRKIPTPTQTDPNEPVHTFRNETYVAKLPDEGIPRLELGEEDDIAGGDEECDIYRIDDDGTLVDVDFTAKVYNLSPASIFGDYVLITRDKYGTWICVNPSLVKIGKTDGDADADTDGNVVSIYDVSDFSDTGDNQEDVYNRTSIDIPADKWVRIERIDGRWFMEPWEC